MITEQEKVGKHILYQQAQSRSLPIGALIRQLRRQRNITQTELGGTHFSKSYVSAIERNKITSSQEALRFFAEQLGQASDYFISLSEQAMDEKHLSAYNEPDSQIAQRSVHQDEALTLLDMLLENSELHNLSTHFELPVLSPKAIAALPAYRQAHYYFLMGLVAKKKQRSSTALQAFETALTLAPPKLHTAILYELGLYYYQMQAYQTALVYHLRALQALPDEGANNTTSDLLYKTELCCGDDYYALGDFKQACTHYERARLQLRSEYNMNTAGQLYRGLGFCTYAAIYLRSSLSLSVDQRATAEEMEQEFQNAIGFLLQSRILYQMSSDKVEETRARLAQAMVLLDFSNGRRQLALQSADGSKQITITKCASLLDEAEEQCRQILMNWATGESLSPEATSVPMHLETDLYLALAYLTRVYIQKASLARLSSHSDTSTYERTIAANLCQEVLDTFTARELPFDVARMALNMKVGNQYASLPRLPDRLTLLENLRGSLESKVAVYFAAGELAEEFACATNEREYAQYCYTFANQCFQRALELARSLPADRLPEPHYLHRCYQRYICLLEERNLTAPNFADENTQTLLLVLEEAFHYFQSPFLSLNIHEA